MYLGFIVFSYLGVLFRFVVLCVGCVFGYACGLVGLAARLVYFDSLRARGLR